jgi:hypothetical protein
MWTFEKSCKGERRTPGYFLRSDYSMDNERLNEGKRLPKYAFDSEYMTEWLREVRFLTEKGIKYTFVKKTQEYGISQFKYRKTPALFAALVEFYSTVEAEKALRKKTLTRKPVAEISPEEIKRATDLLERAIKQGVIKDGIDVAEVQTGEVTINIEKDDTE